jgi:hypothetical protein
MKPIARDISVTLLIKLILLFLLWFFCFKGNHQTVKNAQLWFLGAVSSSKANHSLSHEVNYDSRQ